MEENPFTALIETIRGEAESAAPAGLALGRVTGILPLKVLVGGNTLEAGELLANAALVEGGVAQVSAELRGELSVQASCPNGSHNAMQVTGGTLLGKLTRTEAAFRAGDQLLMLPIEDAQRYIILCRVVAV